MSTETEILELPKLKLPRKKKKKQNTKMPNTDLKEYTLQIKRFAQAQMDFDLILAGCPTSNRPFFYAQTISKSLAAIQDFEKSCDNDFLSLIITTWGYNAINILLESYSFKDFQFPVKEVKGFDLLISQANQWFMDKFNLTTEQIDDFWLTPQLKDFINEMQMWLSHKFTSFSEIALQYISANDNKRDDIRLQHKKLREQHAFDTLQLALRFLDVIQSLQTAKTSAQENMTPFTATHTAYLWKSMSDVQKRQVRSLLTNHIHFGNVINKLRKAAKLTQETLGKIIGINSKTIFRIENGTGSVLKVTVLALMEVFHTHASNELSFTEAFHKIYKDSCISELRTLLLSNYDKDTIFELAKIDSSWLYD